MDKYTENHLLAWADRNAIDDDLVDAMRKLCDDNPDLIDSECCHSWPEIERMAMK
jgi:hypothetical protein